MFAATLPAGHDGSLHRLDDDVPLSWCVALRIYRLSDMSGCLPRKPTCEHAIFIEADLKQPQTGLTETLASNPGWPGSQSAWLLSAGFGCYFFTEHLR